MSDYIIVQAKENNGNVAVRVTNFDTGHVGWDDFTRLENGSLRWDYSTTHYSLCAHVGEETAKELAEHALARRRQYLITEARSWKKD